MTYDFAVWEGEPPSDGRAAGRECARLLQQYLEERELPLTDRMRAFVADLNGQWPDTDARDECADDESPWADPPLVDNASGPFIYIATSRARADEVAVFAAERAKAHGLVCFDVRDNRLLA